MTENLTQGTVDQKMAAAMKLIGSAMTEIFGDRFSLEEAVIIQSLMLGETLAQSDDADSAGTLLECAVANMAINIGEKFPESEFMAPAVPHPIEVPDDAMLSLNASIVETLKLYQLSGEQAAAALGKATASFLGTAPADIQGQMAQIYDNHFNEEFDAAAEYRDVRAAAGGIQ